MPDTESGFPSDSEASSAAPSLLLSSTPSFPTRGTSTVVRVDNTDADRRSATRVWDDVSEDVWDVDLLREWEGGEANAGVGIAEDVVGSEESVAGGV
jgi:hypothetical protein